MKPLTDEQYTVLLKRISKAVYKARYEPATAADEVAVAEEVLRPYRQKQPDSPALTGRLAGRTSDFGSDNVGSNPTP